MDKTSIIILKGTKKKVKQDQYTLVITFEELKDWVLKRDILKHIFRYKTAKILTYHIDLISKPFLSCFILRLLSRKKCYVEDEDGRIFNVSFRMLLKLLGQLIIDFIKKPLFLYSVRKDVENFFHCRKILKRWQSEALPVYIRSDLFFDVQSGGSVSHIAGVLNNLDSYTLKPIFFTTDNIPTVREDIDTKRVMPVRGFFDFNELPTLNYNKVLEKYVQTSLSGKKIGFIYQRYSLNNYSGLKLANHFKVPFVLEYNGSESWINKNWGKRLKYETLSNRIEVLNLISADVIVVVSCALKNELLAREITPEKILVNPNGVDTDRYYPEVNGFFVRQKYKLEQSIVVGFVGTFGRWHGAEVLAEAYGRFMHKFPKYSEQVRLLMIGDGLTMSLVKDKLNRYNVMDKCVLTGLIPQEDGPSYMAACDILVSPHIPNSDGSEFFGSPTKLFEYMAMGKGIVASDLGQIGEVLEHGRTAWLVKPGDVESLMFGLKTLIDSEGLRVRLGQAAREEVVKKYTWKEHTRKIIEKIQERCT